MRHIMVLEREGRMRQEHARHEYRGVFRRARAIRCASRITTRSAPASIGWRSARRICPPSAACAALTRKDCATCARTTEILVIDAPARVHGTELNELVRRAETIVVPVLPSSIDMKACGHFMAELLEIGKVSRKQARLAVVANRVREYTLIYEELDQYLTKLKVPYLGACARRRITCARIRAAWACWSCRNISHGPIGSSGSPSASGWTASGASPEAAPAQGS